jgi:glycerol kinase
VLGCRVEVAAERETTAIGAAVLAGLATGLWDEGTVRDLLRPGRAYEPRGVQTRRDDWRLAVRRALLR